VGLLPPAGRAANGYRDFSEQDVETPRFISRGRSLGFSVDQVHELLALYRDRARASADVKRIAVSRIADIERKMQELASMRDTLQQLARQCSGDERPNCPILADLIDPPHLPAKA
jgi:Cu(I)-responsive transcriptional regulator